MESKLNQSFINVYSQRLASRLAESHFEKAKRITGKEIMTLCPLEQVNYLVMQQLFKSWNAEFEQLRSPFFDYKDKAVQEALKDFMNVLSKHISILRGDFEPLLEQAIRQSILLIFSPYEYFRDELGDFETIKSKRMLRNFRFVRINKHVVEHLAESLEKYFGGSLAGDRATELLDVSFQEIEHGPEDFEPFAAQLSQLIPISVDDIFIDSPTMQEEEDWFEAQGLNRNPKEDDPAPAAESHSWVVDEADAGAVPIEEMEPEPEAVVPPEPESEPEPVPLPEPEPQPEEEIREETFMTSPDDDQSGNLNDRFATEHKTTLHEKLSEGKQEQSIGDALASQPIASIRKSITINQRFMFVNELFDGSTEEFNKAIDQLEQEDGYRAALKFINHHYARSYQWDMDSEEVQEFLSVVAKRFS